MAPKQGDAAAAAGHNLTSLADTLSTTSCLDLAFAIDCTGSMSSYIASAQGCVRQIAEKIVSAEQADIRFSLVGYRDHPPQDKSFVVKEFPFTPKLAEIKRNLNTLSAAGGGDGPEAVADAMHSLLKMDWREEATKVAILIADAPPHGLTGSCGGDGFPNGCPAGLDPMVISRQLAENGVTLYTVGCEPSVNPYRPFFEAVAHATGGQYCGLQHAGALCDAVVGGCQEEMALERLMGDVQAEVAAMGEDMDVQEQTEKVHQLLTSRKARAKKVQRRNHDLPTASACAKQMSAAPTLAEASKLYQPASHGSVTYKSRRSRPRTTKTTTTSSSSGGGFLSSLFGRAKCESRVHDGSDDDDEEEPMGMARASYTGDAATASESYSVVEDSLSVAQCERLVTKSRARQGWSKRA